MSTGARVAFNTRFIGHEHRASNTASPCQSTDHLDTQASGSRRCSALELSSWGSMLGLKNEDRRGSKGSVISNQMMNATKEFVLDLHNCADHAVKPISVVENNAKIIDEQLLLPPEFNKNHSKWMCMDAMHVASAAKLIGGVKLFISVLAAVVLISKVHNYSPWVISSCLVNMFIGGCTIIGIHEQKPSMLLVYILLAPLFLMAVGVYYVYDHVTEIGQISEDEWSSESFTHLFVLHNFGFAFVCVFVFLLESICFLIVCRCVKFIRQQNRYQRQIDLIQQGGSGANGSGGSSNNFLTNVNTIDTTTTTTKFLPPAGRSVLKQNKLPPVPAGPTDDMGDRQTCAPIVQPETDLDTENTEPTAPAVQKTSERKMTVPQRKPTIVRQKAQDKRSPPEDNIDAELR